MSGTSWSWGTSARYGPGTVAVAQIRAGSSGERVAAVGIARVEPGAEPRGALRRRAVRERVRVHAPSRLLLEGVITDGGRSAEALVDVARLEDLLLLRGMTPDACEAVGLQLELDAVLARGDLVAD